MSERAAQAAAAEAEREALWAIARREPLIASLPPASPLARQALIRAYALGSAMRELGEEPVLVDLDPGASLTENAGLIADGNHARDLLDGGGSLDELTAQTVEGLPLVPGMAALLSLIWGAS